MKKNVTATLTLAQILSQTEDFLHNSVEGGIETHQEMRDLNVT